MFEFTSGKALIPEKAKPIAEALGGLAIAWGGLEAQIAVLLGAMLGLVPANASPVLGNIKFVDKLTILKTYGFTMKPNDEWYAELLKCVNQIESHLSKERNRMFHDLWTESDLPEKMLRLTLKPKFNTQGARRLIQEQVEITADEISGLTFRVILAQLTLFSLRGQLESDASKNK